MAYLSLIFLQLFPLQTKLPKGSLLKLSLLDFLFSYFARLHVGLQLKWPWYRHFLYIPPLRNFLSFIHTKMRKAYGAGKWEMRRDKATIKTVHLQCALSDDTQELPAGSTTLRLSPQGRPHRACNVLGKCMRRKGNGLLRCLVRKSKREEWNLIPRALLLTTL